jgi:hypothetical protein
MWRACPKCHALCPASVRRCPNCAPGGAAWKRWLRGVVGAAGLSVLGVSAGCCETPVMEYEGPDAGLPDSGSDGGLDAGLDAGLTDAGTVLCFCPILASYGNFGPCAGEPVNADPGCEGAGTPTCHVCP